MSNVSDSNTPDLGELEHAVLNLVWQSGPVTAEAVRETLRPERVLKDSTIRTVLRRLEEKGFVTHTVENRTFLYQAAAGRQQVAARAVQRVIDWFCNGSTEELLVGMVDTEMLDEKDLERLAARIAAARQAKAAGKGKQTSTKGGKR